VCGQDRRRARYRGQATDAVGDVARPGYSPGSVVSPRGLDGGWPPPGTPAGAASLRRRSMGLSSSRPPRRGFSLSVLPSLAPIIIIIIIIII
jgi:hypothetical protein